jgi:hypothetical protein
MERVLYSAVVLTERSREALLSILANDIPNGWEVIRLQYK